ncbi:MAG: PHP domain-containing protein [Gemmatimonadetes bacterium]|nr:CehA/McbA family metallohydrolase [Gemmatimonadota bacterium]NNM05268.1 PHP domain-containing protein [Gemmatimonadota bacterium]
MHRLSLSLALLVLVSCTGQVPEGRFLVVDCDGCQWYRGNTHSHTTESDGDSSPEYVARWYKDHGYDFLILSDHNTLTDPATIDHLNGDGFLLVPGEEVTSSFEEKAVHVNGLNLRELVNPRRDTTLVGTIQANVDAVRESSGVPHINHPNYLWSMSAQDLAQVEDYRLLEIFNGHPSVHNHGGGESPGMEEVWDILLTQGRRIFGIAVDDAHHYQGEFGPERVNPGRGWVVVKAPDLTAAALMEGLEAGRFYASTGVELEDIVVAGSRLEVHIRQKGDFRYTTTFLGSEGRVLGTSHEATAVFQLTGPEPYVRAKVVDSGGRVAWVQPVFTEGS